MLLAHLKLVKFEEVCARFVLENMISKRGYRLMVTHALTCRGIPQGHKQVSQPRRNFTSDARALGKDCYSRRRLQDKLSFSTPNLDLEFVNPATYTPP